MKINKYLIAIICLFCVLIFGVISVIGEIFTLNEIPMRFMVAFLGAIVTSLITLLLLREQLRAIEEKERNVKIFEKKSQLFEEFNSKLLLSLNNQKITASAYIDLKTEYYSKLMLYLNRNSQNKITEYLTNLGSCVGISLEDGIHDLDFINDYYKYYKENVYNIINILAEELNFGGKINISSLEKLDYTVLPQLFSELLLDEINKIFSNENIFNKAVYSKMVFGTFLVLDFKGKFTVGNGIHIGPFFNATTSKERPVYDGINFRFFTTGLNPMSELYSVKDGNNYNKLFIDFVGCEKGLFNLQESMEEPAYPNVLNINNNIFNEKLDEIRFDDISTLSKYANIYISVAKAIAARTYHYYMNARTKQDNLTIKELYDKFEKITEEQYIEHVLKRLSKSIDFNN